MNIYTQTINPKPGDFDSLGHINNVVYLQWVQDLAEAHWLEVAGGADEHLWVALRHEIDYKREIKPDENIEGSTQVVKMEGVRSERLTKIRNADTGQLKAEARTIWCLLDKGTRKPKRIEEETIKMFM